MTRARTLKTLALLFLALGAWQLGSAGWVHAKALIAQRLIARAWAHAGDTGLAQRPWPGADMRPIARLTLATRGVDLYVLDNASPRALAFGPALVGGTAAPGSQGNTVLVAHRDTHFRFLERVQVGDEVLIEGVRGMRVRYRVSEVTIVDRGETRVLDEADRPQLTLITCFPFDAVMPGTRLRYVVVADRIASSQERIKAS
jgi:sortase A